MNPRLLNQLHMLSEQAQRAKPEQDSDAVVHAFGYVIWLTVLGETQLFRHASASKPALIKLGRRALLARGAGIDGVDSDVDDESRKHAGKQVAEILRVGLQILESNSAPSIDPSAAATALHPPAATLARMLEGKADGLTAGRYALHVLACARCQRVIETLPVVRELAVADVPMLLAASPATRVRSPEDGVIVARRTTPEAEAVLFQDNDIRRLAIYADSDAPLRMVAPGLTTEDAHAGYWIGRVDKDVKELTATLHCGKKSVQWRVKLDDRKTPRRRKSVRKPRG